MKDRWQIVVVIMFVFVLLTFKAGPAACGEKVAIDLRSAKLSDVFYTLSRAAGVNIVTDSLPQEEVTIRMEEIPLSRALDLITKTAGLEYQRLEETIIVAHPDRMSNLSEEIELESQKLSAADRMAKSLEPTGGDAFGEIADYLKSRLNETFKLVDDQIQREILTGITPIPDPYFNRERDKILAPRQENPLLGWNIDYQKGAVGFHMMQPGDNLYRLGLKYGVDHSLLIEKNCISDHYDIPVGTIISIKVGPERIHKLDDGDTFYDISRRFGVSVHRLKELNPRIDINDIRGGEQIVLPPSGEGRS